jgi:thioredoxin-related protein
MKNIALLFVMVLIFNIFDAKSQQPAEVWLKNYQLAQDSARKCNKLILISFSGSDWCKPCIKLREQILDTQEFMQFATNTFVMVQADFPYRSKLSSEQRAHNEALAAIYNKEGAFPKLVITDVDGKVIYSSGYQDYTPAQYIAMLQSHLPANK